MNVQALVLSLALLPIPLAAQAGYRLPPADVVAIVDAPPPPSVQLSPDGRWMLLLEREALPSIADVSRRMLRLAGLRIDPAANARYRRSFLSGLAVRAAVGGETVRVPLPDAARLVSATWAHDSLHFAFTLVTEDASQLWVATAERPSTPSRITERLNGVLGAPRFLPDAKNIVFLEVPADRGEEPETPRVPSGPNVQATSGHTTPLRTYQDLLSNPYDEALFEHYATARVVVAAFDGTARRILGAPALYSDVEPSPNGAHLLVTRLERPWSYLMPLWLFAERIEVWSLDGALEHIVAELPLAEDVPIGGVRTGPRMVAWKAGEPATLVWVEALDGGDPDREVEHRDRWLANAAPFDGEPRELVRVEERAWGLLYLRDPGRVITREYDRDRRWVRSLLHELDDPASEALVLEDRSIRDRYGDPGAIQTELDERGSRVVLQAGDGIFRAGSGATPEGLLPFLDRQSLATLETERLWRCGEGEYEVVIDVLGPDDEGEALFVTRHETPTSPPNYRLHRGGEVVALTDFSDPTPQIRGIRKELVTYEREDGVSLSATLYLPADYEEGTRLPLLLWAYPIEFNDPATAGQVGSSPWRFTRISGSSHLALLTQGYAILDGATIPVIGDPETMNDTFVEQIVAAAAAAIAKAAELGVCDPERVAVAGHSYGAFMTANLLAHSDLFRAGIARSGAYNRTLTPFGFQAERRTLWEAPEAYFRVSPFFHAEEIDEPILLIHGEIDSNSGTFPMQSERLFQAIKGNGGTARLVMLPSESHGYRARESVLHVLAEMIDWLDANVKEARPVEAAYPREED